MQWDASPNAGFAPQDANPWLPMAPDAASVNVAGQAEDPDSILTLTRRLIAIRREHPALAHGDFVEFGPSPDGTFAYERVARDERLTIILNLGDQARTVADAGPGRILIATDRTRDGDAVDAAVELRPNEGIVVERA